MNIVHMVAYSATSGLMALDEEQTERMERPKYITSSYDPIVVTARCTSTIRKAARDLWEILASKLGADVIRKVRTMALVLLNSFRGPKGCDRLIVEEILMSHFGAIVMVTRLAGAKEVLLMGDVNNYLHLQAKPIRDGVHSIKPGGDRHEGTALHLQEPDGCRKFGKGEVTRILTIHKAQSLTSRRTVIVRTTAKLKLYDSISHAVVATARHIVSWVILGGRRMCPAFMPSTSSSRGCTARLSKRPAQSRNSSESDRPNYSVRGFSFIAFQQIRRRKA
ncbi:hypothetical protein EVAR_32983_1 [Eumeta japonica]|uniref:Uncharacterized protein n=1 Tax=Eumeta variegata TaxID=151549 RepID=A0A4C1VSE3_EUMVA|nr:hypothetical protein EVAR_32983_1 [Eumeta japonica]